MTLRAGRCAVSAALVAGLLTPVVVVLGASGAVAANNFTVTDGGDTNAAGQLRTLVAGAVGGDTITFALAVPTVTLTQGEILINKNLTLRGNGPAATTITRPAQAAPFRILHVAAGITATVDLLTVSGGTAATGGGIFDEGALTLTRSTVSGNVATGPFNFVGGGGLTVEFGGSATISSSRIVSNQVISTPGLPRGGGISNNGTLTVKNTAVSNNSVACTGGCAGGGIGSEGPLTVTDSVISANTVATTGTNTIAGGGVWFSGGGVAALAVTSSAITNNSVTGPGNGTGGGLHVSSMTPTSVDRTEISGNRVTGATGSFGGGVGTEGGGPLTVTNSTLSNNTAATTGGAVFGNGFASFTLTLSFTTVAGNNSASAAIARLAGTLTLNNSIVSNASPGVAANCSGAITQTGVNLTFGTNGSCVGAITTDPLLDGLGTNGGVNSTMPLRAGSPALNLAGGTCPPPATDQRGFARNVGACDLGAYEFGAALPDAAPPLCTIVGVVATNPKQMDVSATDVGRGLQAITNPVNSNGTVVVPYFLPGTTLPVVLAAVKADQAQGASWSFDAVDQAMNSRHCA